MEKNFWDGFKERMIELIAGYVKSATINPVLMSTKEDTEKVKIMNDLLKYHFEHTQMPHEVAERVYASMFGRSVEFMRNLKEPNLTPKE